MRYLLDRFLDRSTAFQDQFSVLREKASLFFILLQGDELRASGNGVDCVGDCVFLLGLFRLFLLLCLINRLTALRQDRVVRLLYQLCHVIHDRLKKVEQVQVQLVLGQSCFVSF